MTGTTDNSLGSAQKRLETSRKALFRYMSRHNQEPYDSSNVDTTDEANPISQNRRSFTWSLFKNALRSYWQHHPAQMAVDIGKPFLDQFARKKPMQLVLVAAGLGAALVFIKPWRLISITGLAMAAFKSPKFADVFKSMFLHTSNSARSVSKRNKTSS